MTDVYHHSKTLTADKRV